MENVSQSATIEMWIDRLKAGDDQASKELLNCACARLTRLTHKPAAVSGNK